MGKTKRLRRRKRSGRVEIWRIGGVESGVEMGNVLAKKKGFLCYDSSVQL